MSPASTAARTARIARSDCRHPPCRRHALLSPVSPIGEHHASARFPSNGGETFVLWDQGSSYPYISTFLHHSKVGIGWRFLGAVVECDWRPCYVRASQPFEFCDSRYNPQRTWCRWTRNSHPCRRKHRWSYPPSACTAPCRKRLRARIRRTEYESRHVCMYLRSEGEKLRSGTTSREGQHNVGARANNRERERHSVITQRGTVVVVAPAALGGGVPVVGGMPRPPPALKPAAARDWKATN